MTAKKPKKVPFGSVDISTFFKFEKQIYMKTNYANDSFGRVNAIGPNDGEVRCLMSSDMVVPIAVRVVEDK